MITCTRWRIKWKVEQKDKDHKTEKAKEDQEEEEEKEELWWNEGIGKKDEIRITGHERGGKERNGKKEEKAEMVDIKGKGLEGDKGKFIKMRNKLIWSFWSSSVHRKEINVLIPSLLDFWIGNYFQDWDSQALTIFLPSDSFFDPHHECSYLVLPLAMLSYPCHSQSFSPTPWAVL